MSNIIEKLRMYFHEVEKLVVLALSISNISIKVIV